MKRILTCRKTHNCDSDYFLVTYTNPVELVDPYLRGIKENEVSEVEKIECCKCGEEVEEEY